jgi:hypothetical protein
VIVVIVFAKGGGIFLMNMKLSERKVPTTKETARRITAAVVPNSTAAAPSAFKELVLKASMMQGIELKL